MCRPEILLSVYLFFFSSLATALEKKTICTWDPVGKNGPVMTFYSDLRPKAIAWGLDLEFIAYTDEHLAANDFKSGHCDGVHLSSALSRQFVPFASTLDSIGGIISIEGLRVVIATLASSNANKVMTNNQYETVASWPVGSVFAFVNDKTIDSVSKFNRKRIAAFNNDRQIHQLARMTGSTPIDVSLTTVSEQFNSGNIDIVFMPALAFNTYELYRGLGNKGGLLDHHLFYDMLHTTIKKESFPDNFGNKMRNYVLNRLADIEKLMLDAENEIPEKFWIRTNKQSNEELIQLSRQVRLALKEVKLFEPKALILLWKIRCNELPTANECLAQE